MKKVTLFLLILFSCNLTLKSQKLQLKGDSILSCNIGEWQKWKLLYLKTNYDSSIYGKIAVYMYNNENELVLDSDTISNYYDSIGSGDSMLINNIFKYYQTEFYDNFGDSFIETGMIPSGNYKIIIKMFDTLNNYLGDSCYKQIQIINEYLPSLLSPTFNSELVDSTINNTTFSWLKPKNSTYPILYYNFKIFEFDSNDLENLEYCYENNNTIFTAITSSNILNLNGFDLNTALEIDKWYAWSIKTYKDSLLTEPLFVNKGISYPYIFSKSNKKRGNSNGCCDNPAEDGFEDGTMNGWIGKTGVKFPLDHDNGSQLGDIRWDNQNNDGRNHYSIVSKPAVDALTNIPVVPPGGGNNALKLGSEQVDGDVDKISKSFTVENCNKIFKVRYAFILNDYKHVHVDQSAFMIAVYRGGIGSQDQVMSKIIYSGHYDPTFQNVNDVTFRDWDCEILDLSRFMGETVTIEIFVTDCALGGHYGYTYIDFCGNTDISAEFDINEGYCISDLENDNIIADGSASTNLVHWLWTVQSTDDQENSRGQEIISEWRHGKGAESNFNLKDMIKATGFTCGKFRIKLAGSNGCNPWIENVKIITISCPQNNLAGNDKCCNNGFCNIMIGKAPIQGLNYEWTPSNCLSNSNIANPYFNPNNCNPNVYFPLHYTLKVTDAYGCVGYDEMVIYNSPPIITNMIQDSINENCQLNLDFDGYNYNSIKWEWVEHQNDNNPSNDIFHTTTDKRFIFPRFKYDIQVTLTLTNPCGTTSNTFTVNKRRIQLILKDLIIIFPNVINLNSQNNVLRISEFGIDYGTPNAYFGATDAKLEILVNDGGIFKVWEYNNTTFLNGQLFWDGKVDGKFLPIGVYQWRLSLKNCQQSKWESNFTIFGELKCKKKKTRWLGKGFIIPTKVCVEEEVEFIRRQLNEITIKH